MKSCNHSWLRFFMLKILVFGRRVLAEIWVPFFMIAPPPSPLALLRNFLENDHFVFKFNSEVDLQLYSEKCTGRYFKGKDDDLFSKQGSLFIQNDTYKNYSKMYI